MENAMPSAHVSNYCAGVTENREVARASGAGVVQNNITEPKDRARKRSWGPD